MPRDKVEEFCEGCAGIVFLAFIVSFFFLLHYAANAYPHIEGYSANSSGQVTLNLLCGSYCDPPGKLVKDFQEKNPHIEIEGYSVSETWQGKRIEIRLKKRENK